MLVLVLAGAGVSVAPPPAYAVASDSFEGDDTQATARDVSAILGLAGDTGWYGEPMGAQSRTFHFIDEAGVASDEDWVRFSVSVTDIDSGYSYVFEAIPASAAVSPVIEVYGPDSATPAPPGSLPPGASDPAVTGIDPNAIQPETGSIAYNERWSDGASASVSFLPRRAGAYFVRIRPYYQHAAGDDPGFRGGVGAYTLRTKTGQLSRLAGVDRIATAIAVSRERFPVRGPGSRACVVATGFAFPDALAGSTLAGAIRGPLLLTFTDRLPAGVAAEIRRLGVNTVYVLGGTAAVSSQVRTAIAGLGVRVVPVGGRNRTETARLIALESAKHAPVAKVAFVVNANNFPDALVASPMAAHNVAPILLTGATALDPQTEAALKDPRLGVTDVVIVGGTAVVSQSVQNHIASVLGGATRVRRIPGSSRYQTARNFAVWATKTQSVPVRVGTPANPSALESLDFARIGIASGENFPDALAGGVLCGLARSPILLTHANRVSPWLCADFDLATPPTVVRGRDYWFASDLAILRGYVLGGRAALWNEVFLPLDLWSGPGPTDS